MLDLLLTYFFFFSPTYFVLVSKEAGPVLYKKWNVGSTPSDLIKSNDYCYKNTTY